MRHQPENDALPRPHVVTPDQAKLALEGADIAVGSLGGDQFLRRPVQQLPVCRRRLVGVASGQGREPLAPIVRPPLLIPAVGLVAKWFDEPVEVPGGDEVLHAVGHPLAEVPAHLDLTRWQAALHIRHSSAWLRLIGGAAGSRAYVEHGSQGKRGGDDFGDGGHVCFLKRVSTC